MIYEVLKESTHRIIQYNLQTDNRQTIRQVLLKY